MPNLKEFRNRIKSVKSTRKITSAMKMVAAAKLRRATERATQARPYAMGMEGILANLAQASAGSNEAPKLLRGTGSDRTQLLVVMTSDRGLCGAFNGSISRRAKAEILRLQSLGKTVKIYCVGRKGRDYLKREFSGLIIGHAEDVGKPQLSFADAEKIAVELQQRFDAGEFDVAHILYNKFQSAMVQIVTVQQVIPASLPAANQNQPAGGSGGVYEFEPEPEEILAELLPRNLRVQIYRGLLENNASEQGARMVAMDNATRNAGKAIDKLNLNYNRARQAYITKEMIEIVSGAEAV
jgi:F-type H+-transporting ATPase subunit gamma